MLILCEKQNNPTRRPAYHRARIFVSSIAVSIPVKAEFKKYGFNLYDGQIARDIFHIETARVLDHSDCSAPCWPDFDPIALLQALVNAARIIHA